MYLKSGAFSLDMSIYHQGFPMKLTSIKLISISGCVGSMD